MLSKEGLTEKLRLSLENNPRIENGETEPQLIPLNE